VNDTNQPKSKERTGLKKNQSGIGERKESKDHDPAIEIVQSAIAPGGSDS
jgi:hypothetical protein